MLYMLSRIIKYNLDEIKSVTILIVFKLIQLAVPILSLPILYDRIEVSELGNLLYHIAILDFGTVISLYGYEISGLKNLSEARKSKDVFIDRFNVILTSKLILFTLIYIVVSSVAYYSPYLDFDLVMLLTPYWVLSQFLLPWVLVALGEARTIPKVILPGKVSLILVLYFFSYNAGGYIFALTLDYFVSCAVMYYFIYKRGCLDYALPSRVQIVESLKDNFYFFLSRLSVIVYSRLSTMIMGYKALHDQVAIFLVAEKISNGIKVPTGVVSQVFFSKTSIDKNFHNAMCVGGGLFVISSCISLIIFFNFETVLFYLTSGNVPQDYESLLPMIAIVPFSVISSYLGGSILIVFGKENIFNLSTYVSVILYFIFLSVFFFIYGLSLRSIVYTIFLVELSIFFIRFYGVTLVYSVMISERNANE